MLGLIRPFPAVRCERLPRGSNEVNSLKTQADPFEITQHYTELTLGTWEMFILRTDSLWLLEREGARSTYCWTLNADSDHLFVLGRSVFIILFSNLNPIFNFCFSLIWNISECQVVKCLPGCTFYLLFSAASVFVGLDGVKEVKDQPWTGVLRWTHPVAHSSKGTMPVPAPVQGADEHSNWTNHMFVGKRMSFLKVC